MSWVELNDGGLLVSKGMTLEIDKAGKGMVAMVSTEGLDTDGDIIRQTKTPRGRGWILDGFNKTPFMTWMHDKQRPNIASPDVRAHVRAHKGGHALFLDPFAFDPGDTFAQELEGKYSRRVLRETSVGYTSKVWEPIDTGREFFEQTLIEVAAVNVGANRETDTMIKSMLSRSGLVAKVQAAGDSEVEELKSEIIYLREELRLISNEVKRMGDRMMEKDFSGQVAGGAVSPRAQSQEDAVTVMADLLYRRLREIGTAQ